MSIVDTILAKLAGFDPKETHEATLIRTQIGHAPMPDHTAGGERFRQQTVHEENLSHEREQRQKHTEFRSGEEAHPMTPEVSLDKQEAKEA